MAFPGVLWQEITPDAFTYLHEQIVDEIEDLIDGLELIDQGTREPLIRATDYAILRRMANYYRKRGEEAQEEPEFVG